MKKITWILWILLACISTAQAAIVTGKVTDIDHKPIPYAIISIPAANKNTTANEHGVYIIELENGTHELICESIDFAAEIIEINVQNDSQTVNIQLKERINNLEDVIFHANGEDPAIYKMRQVIKNKDLHQKKISTLETDIYLKGSLRTTKFPKKLLGQEIPDTAFAEMGLNNEGKGILYLLEQNTHYYYQAPDKSFNHVKSVRTSGDPQGLGFAQMPPIINVYSNTFSIISGISTRGFVSPAHNNAFWFYDFKLESTYFDENEKLINKIKVIPKRKYEPLFSGYVYVVEDDWVFKAVDLTVDKTAGLNIIDTLHLAQTYALFPNTNWVIKNQNMGLHLNVMGFGMGGNFITNYSNLKINEPIDKQVFNQKFISTYDTSALSQDKTYWDSTRQIPLTAEEEKNFTFKDSQQVALDSIYKVNANKRYTSMGFTDWLTYGPSIRQGKTKASLNPIIDMFNFNTVEGLNTTLAPKLAYRINQNESISMQWHSRYGWSSETWYNKLNVTYNHLNKKEPAKKWSISIDGGRYIQDISSQTSILPIYNTISTLLYGKNYLKLYQKDFAAIQLDKHLGNGLSFRVGATYEDRSPLENTTTYNWSKNKEQYITPNNPASLPIFEAHQAAILSAEISYQHGWKYIQYPKYIAAIPSAKPIFTAKYTKGITGILGSDVDFDIWQISMKHALNLNLLGNVKYHLETGGFLNNTAVGNPDMIHFIGNQISLASPYISSFQIAPYYKYSTTGSHYARGHVEWHLGGLLSNKIPGLRQLNWHIVTGANALHTFDNNYYAEVFVGLENIGISVFKILRVDFVLGYESGRAAPSTGIRLGMNMNAR